MRWPKFVGDDDATFRRRGVVEVQLRAAAVALAAERGDVAHDVLTGVFEGGEVG
jgi:hypothetical protein